MSRMSDMEATLEYTAGAEERARLQDFDLLIDEWIRRLVEDLRTAREHTSGLDETFVTRFRETALRFSKRLNDELPPFLEADALAEIRGIIVEALTELDEINEDRPWDTVEVFVLRAEAIRHLIRDALDEQLQCEDRDSQGLVLQLGESLPRVGQREIARLLDISVRQLQRWKTGGGDPSRRLLLVTRLAALLRHAWTPEGIVAWFDRPRRDLAGQSPIDVLDDPTYEPLLVTAARQGRAQHGS